MSRTLSARVPGRAVLDRQLLFARAELPVVTAVERILGLNAQDPNLPYLALWSRLPPTLTVEPFRPLAAADRDTVEAEAHRLLAFTEPAAERREARLGSAKPRSGTLRT